MGLCSAGGPFADRRSEKGTGNAPYAFMGTIRPLQFRTVRVPPPLLSVHCACAFAAVFLQQADLNPAEGRLHLDHADKVAVGPIEQGLFGRTGIVQDGCIAENVDAMLVQFRNDCVTGTVSGHSLSRIPAHAR